MEDVHFSTSHLRKKSGGVLFSSHPGASKAGRRRLRADLQRQFQNLLALGWLGRAYQLFPWAVSAVWPSLFE